MTASTDNMSSPLSPMDLARIAEAFPDPVSCSAAVRRAEGGEPVAYVTGEQTFFRESYIVTPDVLIPRPDTERVVEAAISLCRDGSHVLDLCTGSGCIAVSLKKNAGADITVDAADISPAALEIAKKNSVRNGADVSFSLLDVTDIAAVGAFCAGRQWDIIISNPPYIDTSVCAGLDPSVRDYEPMLALDGGDDGMRFYRAILDNFSPYITAGGAFVFEIGYDQREKLTAEAERRGMTCTVTKDWGGNDRVGVVRKADV